ncbi:MAG: methyltransferase [Rhodospirillaceae bacterium]|nr:methyltransferase [Rhodospirillaceae bacterium]
MPADPAARAAFIRANTALSAPRLIPEIRLYQADRLLPLWRATEPDLKALGLPPPYWAFAWAGGQALARYILDHPETVRGKTVLDFGAGSGLGAIAAAKAGARRAIAAEIDAFAATAIALNAEANGVAVEIVTGDVLGSDDPAWETAIAGDVCYEQPMARTVRTWLGRLARRLPVLIGDPRRSYFDAEGLEMLARYAVPTTTEIEDSDLRNAAVWRVL